jgi:hypothetical protein
MEQRRTRKKEVATPKMKSILLLVPEEKHYALKLQAVTQKTTVRKLINDAIELILKEGAKEKK